MGMNKGAPEVPAQLVTTDCLAQMIRSTTSWFNIIPNETVSIKTGIKHICYGYIYGLEVNVLIVKDFSFRLAKYGGYLYCKAEK